MPRKFLKRHLPDAHELRRRHELRLLGRLLEDPFLFHLNRRSVAGGVAIGLFVAFLPTPGQMPIAALLAIGLRANLLLSVALVWISNPITMAPLFYFDYMIGAWLLGGAMPYPGFEPSLSWFWHQLAVIWKPLLLGSVVVGTIVALAGYGAVHLVWRLYILRHLRHRKQRRRRRAARRPLTRSAPDRAD